MKFKIFLSLICLMVSTDSFAMQIKLNEEETREFLSKNPPSHPVVERAVDIYNSVTAHNWKTLTDLLQQLEGRKSEITSEFLTQVKARVERDKTSFSNYFDEIKGVKPEAFMGIFPVQNICDILAQGCRNGQGVASQRPILDEVFESLTAEKLEKLGVDITSHSLHDHQITVAKNTLVYVLNALDPQTFNQDYFLDHKMAYGIPMLPEELESLTIKGLKESFEASPLWAGNRVLAFNAGFQFGWPPTTLHQALLSQFNGKEDVCQAYDAASFVAFVVNSPARLSIIDVDILWQHLKGKDVGEQKGYSEHLAAVTSLKPVESPMPGDIVYNRIGGINFAVYLKEGEEEGTYFGLATRKAGDGMTWEGPGIGKLIFNNPQILYTSQ
ncbi:MAG: hypothetical protein JSS34_05070 [Proteobacteria bacterium]|nr:hypothetical protein [Pseudomonadota bacterium]